VILSRIFLLAAPSLYAMIGPKLTMKPLRFLVHAIVLSAALAATHAQATNTNSTTILGQWDFNSSNNLATATVGSPLQFVSFTPQFAQQTIGDQSVGVISFDTLTDAQRILATYARTNNGGGTNLNQYTIIMDVMWPAAADGAWRSLFNADTNNSDDGEIFVNPDGSIGNFNNYAGRLLPNTWYRVALVYDLATNQMARYLNGTNLSGTNVFITLPLPDGAVDGRFSLNGGILFFSDNDGETAPAFVNVLQLRAGIMTDEQIFALGGPASNDLGEGVPAPTNITIESITRNGNNVIITVANAGRNIQLQQSATVGPTASWSNVGTPTNVSQLPPVAISGNMAFFRVLVL